MGTLVFPYVERYIFKLDNLEAKERVGNNKKKAVSDEVELIDGCGWYAWREKTVPGRLMPGGKEPDTFCCPSISIGFCD